LPAADTAFGASSFAGFRQLKQSRGTRTLCRKGLCSCHSSSCGTSAVLGWKGCDRLHGPGQFRPFTPRIRGRGRATVLYARGIVVGVVHSRDRAGSGASNPQFTATRNSLARYAAASCYYSPFLAHATAIPFGQCNLVKKGLRAWSA